MQKAQDNGSTAKKGAAQFETVEVVAAALFIRAPLQSVGRDIVQ